MKRCLAMVLMSAIVGCAATPQLSDFTSDGCSLFPDGNFQDPKKWCECCYQHDIAYWRGGTQQDRLAADEQLRTCVAAKTGDLALAQMMFIGVRGGGGPRFPTGYRWGFGWNYGRDYAPLSGVEQNLVDEKLARVPAAKRQLFCESSAR